MNIIASLVDCGCKIGAKKKKKELKVKQRHITEGV